jgi:hypothetical protein
MMVAHDEKRTGKSRKALAKNDLWDFIFISGCFTGAKLNIFYQRNAEKQNSCT